MNTLKLNRAINNRHRIVQANRHSYDKFLSLLKTKGLYLGFQHSVDYYFLNGYVCNIVRNPQTLEIEGAGLTVDLNRIPKQIISAYNIVK